MSNITEKLQQTILKEELKLSENQFFEEFKKTVQDLEDIGMLKKPTYDLPLRSTIGKYNFSLNKNK